LNTQPTSTVIYKNPEQFYEQEIRREILNRYNTAFEIFMAEQYTRIRYSELMDVRNDVYASKQRLLSWINDSITSKGTRPGILAKYRESHPEHFENGVWQARYFSCFIYYAYKLLVDKAFVKKEKIADEFSRSFKNEEWFWQAVAVLGAKLLEYLYDMNALQTDIAKAYVKQIKLSRRLLEDIGRITGRVAKNYNENYGDDEEINAVMAAIRRNIEETFKQQISLSYQIFKSQKEYQLYQEYKQLIRSDIIQIYQKEILKIENPPQKALPQTGSKVTSKGWW